MLLRMFTISLVALAIVFWELSYKCLQTKNDKGFIRAGSITVIIAIVIVIIFSTKFDTLFGVNRTIGDMPERCVTHTVE